MAIKTFKPLGDCDFYQKRLEKALTLKNKASI